MARQLGGSRRALAVAAAAAAAEEAGATKATCRGQTLSQRSLLPSPAAGRKQVRSRPGGPVLAGPWSRVQRQHACPRSAGRQPGIWDLQSHHLM